MTDEQAAALHYLRALARPHRFRVLADAEGWPVVPGKLGQIEWYCDGKDCWSCPMPGELALAVDSTKPRLFAKLWAIPGGRPWQVGDQEMRAVFPPEALAQVAGVIRARRRARRPMTPERLARLAEGRRQKALAPPMSALSRP